MLVVIAIISVLLVAGINVIGGTGPQSRRAASDTLTGMIEQARTTAITTRSTVFLAIAEPGDLPTGDLRCRVGLFEITSWPPNAGSVDAVLLRRWDVLPLGVVLIPGQVDGLRNPLDLPEITIRHGSAGKPVEGRFHGIAFTPRGGLHWPEGSDPIGLRIAEGTYRQGRPQANGGGVGLVPEDRLKIGRVVARPYRSN